jgi:hypothetical protein
MHNNLSYFDLSLDDFGSHFHLKMLSDLALFVGLYKRKIIDVKDSRIYNIVSFMMEKLEKANYIDRLSRIPESLLLYAPIYVSLYEYGYELKEFKYTIQSIVDQKTAIMRECIPFKTLDLCYPLSKANVNYSSPNLKYLFNKTILSKKISILSLNLEDVYDIVHTVFYLSDFGFKKLKEISINDITSIRWMIASLIGIFLRNQNWDVLSELLLSCACLKWYPKPVYNIAWQNILNVQGSDGSIPAPSQYLEKVKKIDPEISNKSKFIRNYHTTLVHAMACLYMATQNHRNISFIKYEFSSQDKLKIIKARRASEKASEWIRHLNKNSNLNMWDQNSLLYILLGEYIHHVGLLSKNPDSMFTAASDIVKKLDLLPSDYNSRNINTNLALLGMVILQKLRLKSNILEEFKKIPLRVVKMYPPRTEKEEIMLFQTYYLLEKLGIDTLSSRRHIRAQELSFEYEDLYTSNDTWKWLINYIEATSFFGRKKICFNRHLKLHIYNSLCLSLLDSLYRHDLIMGNKLMKTMSYLNMQETRSFKQGFNFLIAQQRFDGRFGFLAPEISKTNLKSKDTVNFYLPTTVHTLWSLTEIINPQFRLFQHI